MIAGGAEDTLAALQDDPRAVDGHDRAEARRHGLHRLCRADPRRSRGRHRRPGLPDRGLQRARRRRRLHVRLPARLAARRGPSRLRDLGQCLRRLRRLAPALLAGISRPGRSCSSSSKHGSPHQALRKDEAINHIHWATTRRRDSRTADGARHRSSHAARGDGATTPARPARASPTSRCWRSKAAAQRRRRARRASACCSTTPMAARRMFDAAQASASGSAGRWSSRARGRCASSSAQDIGSQTRRMAGRPTRSSACASTIRTIRRS